MQLPPLFSALKMDGKPLYEYAREGKEIPREIQRRPVDVLNLEMIEWMEGGTHPHEAPTDEAGYAEINVANKLWTQEGILPGVKVRSFEVCLAFFSTRTFDRTNINLQAERGILRTEEAKAKRRPRRPRPRTSLLQERKSRNTLQLRSRQDHVRWSGGSFLSNSFLIFSYQVQRPSSSSSSHDCHLRLLCPLSLSRFRYCGRKRRTHGRAREDTTRRV